jgi:hypothetical protein
MRSMQPASPISQPPPIGRTERPPVSPLAQLVAKVLNAPAPTPAAAPEPQAAASAKDQPPARADGRHTRLGSYVDIRV